MKVKEFGMDQHYLGLFFSVLMTKSTYNGQCLSLKQVGYSANMFKLHRRNCGIQGFGGEKRTVV